MPIEEHLLIALVAALINIILSIFIPPLVSNSDLPFTQEIKNHYECNKNFILISTLLTILMVYVSLKVTPFINSQLGNIAALNIVSKPVIESVPK